MEKQRQKISDLEDKLAVAYESCTNFQDSTPIDIIFDDLCRNRNVDPHGRRYSVETISWAREIQRVLLRFDGFSMFLKIGLHIWKRVFI
jgi:hypothetical protein